MPPKVTLYDDSPSFLKVDAAEAASHDANDENVRLRGALTKHEGMLKDEVERVRA